MRDVIKACESKLLIGLVKDEDFFDINQEHVGFVVKPLCEEARLLYDMDCVQDPLYYGYDYDQSSEILPQFYYLLEHHEIDIKLNKMKEEFKDKLVIFKPRFYESKASNKYELAVEIQAMCSDIEDSDQFVMVPEIKMNVNEFEALLASQDYFRLNYHHDVNEAIEVIVCGKYAYRIKNPYGMKTIFEVNANNPYEYRLKDLDGIVKIDLKNYASKYIVRYDQHVFIEDQVYTQLMSCDQYEECDLYHMNEMMKEKMMKNREVDFIKGLSELTSSKGLQYDYKDLINFHTSIKTTPLTILAGMSGTGKTQLAYNYARMLSLSEEDHTLLFVPISPSYSEPSDILGYINAMNHMYVPSETGLVKFLNHAAQNENQMHFIIFDEMNLSQVEHWFSSFISILEKDLKERILTIYDDDVRCDNADIYPAKIALKDNLIFIGTLNIDETTKDFSDRLLDRTSVISLHKGKFTTFYQNYQTICNKSKTEINCKDACKDALEFLSWKKSSSTNYMNAFDGHYEELAFLDELDELIKKYIPNGGISYRVLRNIANYMNNVACDSEGVYVIDRKEVFDLVINQTIMTKIRGSESQLGLLLGYIEEQSQNIIQSDLLDLLSKYTNISLFIEVRKTIYRKAKDLMIHGYTN